MGFKWNFLSAFLPITVIGRCYLFWLFVALVYPFPEDITLVSGGVIAGLYPESVNSHLMLVVSMIGVLAGDSTMYWLGRIYGTRILRFRPMRKLVTLERLKMVREKFAQYGTAYYLSPVSYQAYAHQFIWFSGITRRVSYTRFVLIDFCAAIISVPIWVYLGEFGAKNLDWLHEQIKKGQLVIYILIGVFSSIPILEMEKSEEIQS